MTISTRREFPDSTQPDGSLQNESSVASQLAQTVLDVVYNQWQEVWNSPLNPEPSSAPYREIPKFPQGWRAKEQVGKSKGFLTQALKNILAARASNETSSDTAEIANRGWRVVIQRNTDGSATIFYAGQIPGSTEFAGQPGLKIFYVTSDQQLFYGYLADLTCPGDNSLLSTAIAESSWGNSNWKSRLRSYDSLDHFLQEQIGYLLILPSTEIKPSLLGIIQKDIQSREMGLGGEYPFDV